MAQIIRKLIRTNIQIVMWLTRVAGVVFVIAGLAFFILAIAEKSMVPVAMGLLTIAFGLVAASVHAPSPDRLEYKLLRLRRKTTVKAS
jgi:hypothetical protein